MQMMLGEIVIIAFALGGIIGATVALHLKAIEDKGPSGKRRK